MAFIPTHSYCRCPKIYNYPSATQKKKVLVSSFVIFNLYLFLPLQFCIFFKNFITSILFFEKSYFSSTFIAHLPTHSCCRCSKLTKMSGMGKKLTKITGMGKKFTLIHRRGKHILILWKDSRYLNKIISYTRILHIQYVDVPKLTSNLTTNKI